MKPELEIAKRICDRFGWSMQDIKPDMNDRMDGCKSFWVFVTAATLAGVVFIVLSSGVWNG